MINKTNNKAELTPLANKNIIENIVVIQPDNESEQVTIEKVLLIVGAVKKI